MRVMVTMETNTPMSSWNFWKYTCLDKMSSMYINIYLSLLPLFDLIVQLLLRSLGRQLCRYLALLLHDCHSYDWWKLGSDVWCHSNFKPLTPVQFPIPAPSQPPSQQQAANPSHPNLPWPEYTESNRLQREATLLKISPNNVFGDLRNPHSSSFHESSRNQYHLDFKKN